MNNIGFHVQTQHTLGDYAYTFYSWELYLITRCSCNDRVIVDVLNLKFQISIVYFLFNYFHSNKQV